MQADIASGTEPTVVEDGVGFTLQIEGMETLSFLVTKEALVQRFRADPSPAGLLAAYRAGAQEINSVAVVKLTHSMAAVTVIDVEDFPAREGGDDALGAPAPRAR